MGERESATDAVLVAAPAAAAPGILDALGVAQLESMAHGAIEVVIAAALAGEVAYGELDLITIAAAGLFFHILNIQLGPFRFELASLGFQNPVLDQFGGLLDQDPDGNNAAEPFDGLGF